MQPKPKRSSFTVYAILTTITLLTWVVYGAYERLQKIDLAVIPPKVLSPITPTLDTQALDLLENKKHVSEQQIQSFVPSTSSQINQESTVNEVPESTESATQ